MYSYNYLYENHLKVFFKGWNELKDLGKDYRNTFPDLFGNAYSAERLRFDHSNVDGNRTEASYKAFVEGLFGDGSYNDIILDRSPQPNKIQRVCHIQYQIYINKPPTKLFKQI